MTRSEARDFFVSRIVSEAEAAGDRLSRDELAILALSNLETDEGPPPDRAGVGDKVTPLVRSAYRREIAADARARARYVQARTALTWDDYLSFVVDNALRRELRSRPARLARGGWLFVLLGLPAVLLLWMAVGSARFATEGPGGWLGRATGVAVVLAFALMSTYLVFLWRRESRR